MKAVERPPKHFNDFSHTSFVDIDEESRESIEILKEYAAAVNREPDKYPVILAEQFVYVNASDVMLYIKELQRKGQTFAILNSKGLVKALKFDGLIESEKEIRRVFRNSRVRFHKISRKNLSAAASSKTTKSS